MTVYIALLAECHVMKFCETMQERHKLAIITKKTVTVSVPMTSTYIALLRTSGEISSTTHRNGCM